MWLTSGRASGRKNAAPILFISTPGKEVQPYRKTEYKPMMMIPQDISVVLIKSLVMSRLDYSNGLLYGLPKCTVSGLQAVQNSAARIVTQESLRDHYSMSHALMELHWLPVDKRIEYKLLLYTYKALHGLAPWYLCKLVVPYEPLR